MLRLVETVPVELVDEVAAFRAHADATEAILESCAEVAGKLRPGAVGIQLMYADGARAAEQVGNERSGACRDRVAQHEPSVIRELVELAASDDRGGAYTILRPVPAGAQADQWMHPIRRVDRSRPAESPVGGAGVVEVGGAGQAAKGGRGGEALAADTGRRLRTRDGERRVS